MSKSNGNLLLFPPSRIVNAAATALQSNYVPETIDEIKDVMVLNRQRKVNQIMERLIPLLVNGFVAHGIVLGEEDKKQTAFLLESIRSLVSHKLGVEHHFQKLANTVFEFGENGSLNVLPVEVNQEGGEENNEA